MDKKAFGKCFRVAFLAISAITVFSFAREKYSCDLDIYQLKGKVKSVQETKIIYDTTSGTPTMSVYYIISRKFNEQGNGVETFFFGRGDTVIRRESDVYRNNGNGQVRETYVEDLRKGGKRKQQEYVYGKDGKLVQVTYFGTIGGKTSIVEYDGKGNECRIIHFIRNGGLVQRTELNYNYDYDSTGRLIKEYGLNEDGSLINKMIHKYDTKGNAIETDVYNTDSTLTRKISAQFDTLGNVTDIFDAYYYIGGGDLGQKCIDRYDDSGNKVEEDTYQIKADGSVILEKALLYENDSKGNWIKETSFGNNRKGTVSTRVIEYY
jgi:hypothetical protein